jgi:hypothetical integral membrane protein (TIGR02206 family)
VDLSAEHLITIAVIAAAITVLVVAARRRPGQWTVPAARALAVVVLANEAAWWVWLSLNHSLSLAYALPLQLCDVAAVLTALALWVRTPLLVELTYFWGIAGTANALFTPDISDHFPAFPFLQYFVQHGAIVGAALFLVIGLRITPRPWAFLRVYALTVVLLAVDALANLLTGGNYLYLRQLPGVKSVLNLMGPWPWYIVGAALLALVLFVLLDLPFRIGALSRARSKTSPYPPPASPPSPRPRPGR